MDSGLELTPWILDSVLAERQDYLSGPSRAGSSDTFTVDGSQKRLIQILGFNGQKKQPFTRVGISDSATEIRAKLSPSATTELQRSTGRPPPSRIEGAVCELTQYSLIFDPTSPDGVSVDIQQLVYKGGACSMQIGQPRRISEQEGASEIPRAMRFSPSKTGRLFTYESPSSQVLSQAGDMADDMDNTSQGLDIATQAPQRRDDHSKNEHTTGVMHNERLLQVLTSFQGREKAGSKRPSPTHDTETPGEVHERPQKRQHLDQMGRKPLSPVPLSRGPAVPIKPRSEASSRTATAETVRHDPVRQNVTEGSAKSHRQNEGEGEATGPAGLSPHLDFNKALPDSFYIGVKKLSKKWVSPPKSQLQLLSHGTRYIDPRSSTDEQAACLPSDIISVICKRNGSGLQSDVDETASEPAQTSVARTSTVVMDDIHTTQLPPQELASTRPSSGEDGNSEVVFLDVEAEVADVGRAVSWSPSPPRSPISSKNASNAGENVAVLNNMEDHESDSEALTDDDQVESSPFRLPSPSPPGLRGVLHASSFVNASLRHVEAPSSSLSMDFELTQEVPLPLHTSPEPELRADGSLRPIPRLGPMADTPIPELQIERSPFGKLAPRWDRPSILRGQVSLSSNTRASSAQAERRALSSDPVIPATCAEAQEATTSQEVGADQGPLYAEDAHRVLVPATIPAREACASRRSSPTSRNGPDAFTSSSASIGASPVPESQTFVPQSSATINGMDRSPPARKTDAAEPTEKRQRTNKVRLVAPEFSQLTSSVDTAEMARENRRTFLTKPVQGEVAMAEGQRMATPTTMQESGNARHTEPVSPIDRSPTHTPNTKSSSRVVDERPRPVLKDNANHPGNSLQGEVSTVDRPISTSGVPPVPPADIYNEFKHAYPSFKHDRGHFILAGTYIQWLLDNRKVMPVHQSLWDDFIRTFCGPYSAHIKTRRLDGQRKAMSAVDFYNTEIESPLFTRNIVTRRTLPDVLALDAAVAAKHTKRLRRISTNFIAPSAVTTPSKQRADDSATPDSPPQARSTRTPLPNELQEKANATGLNPGRRPMSPILGEPVVEESTTSPVITTIESIRGSPKNRPYGAPATSRTKPPAVTNVSAGAVKTPKNADDASYIVLTRSNKTPIRLPMMIDPISEAIAKKYEPRQPNKSRKARSRYSLPGLGSS